MEMVIISQWDPKPDILTCRALSQFFTWKGWWGWWLISIFSLYLQLSLYSFLQSPGLKLSLERERERGENGLSLHCFTLVLSFSLSPCFLSKDWVFIQLGVHWREPRWRAHRPPPAEAELQGLWPWYPPFEALCQVSKELLLLKMVKAPQIFF